MGERNNVENFRAGVGSCEESVLSPVKVRKRCEKVGGNWTAQGFECEVEKSGLKMLCEDRIMCVEIAS